MQDMDFAELSTALNKLESDYLHVDPYQCVRLRHRKAQCRLCQEACPTEVITWGDSVVINKNQCIECGLCASVCPTGAFEALQPTNEEIQTHIEQIAATAYSIAFACPRAGRRGSRRVIQVTCLGRLDASILFAAGASGIRQIDLVDDVCQNCPNGANHIVAENAIKEANALYKICGLDTYAQFSQHSELLEIDGTTPPNTKVTVSSPPFSSVEFPSKGALSTRSPEKHILLSDSLQKVSALPEPTWLDTHLWATVKVKSTCTGCLMCAFFCPTGALSKSEVDGKPALTFIVANCVNCHLCEEVCYTNSIICEPLVDLSGVQAKSTVTIWSDIQLASQKEKIKRLKLFRR